MQDKPNLVTMLFLHSYFRAFPSRAEALVPGRGTEIARKVRRAYPLIIEGNRDLLIDRPAHQNMTMAAVVLASYRALMAELDDEAKVIRALKDTFCKFVKAPLQLGLRTALTLSGDPLKLVAKAFSNSVCEKVYGATFVFETELTPYQLRLETKRCFFFEFFRAQGLPHLTEVLCAWDSNWVDVVNNGRWGVRAVYHSRYSTGGTVCRVTLGSFHSSG